GLMQPPPFPKKMRGGLSEFVLYQAALFLVADFFLPNFFHPPKKKNPPTAVTNFTHCNLADGEIDAARIETDAAKQKALWKTAQEKLIREVCGVPIYEQLQVWAWKDSLDLGYELKGSLNLSPPIIEKTRFPK